MTSINATRGFDFPGLGVGTMFGVPHGRLELPVLPDLPMTGKIWVTHTSPDSLRFTERVRVAGFINGHLDVELKRIDPGHVTYAIEGRIGPLPVDVIKTYRIVREERGLLEFVGVENAREAVSSIRTDGSSLKLELVGPTGMYTKHDEHLYQPGDAGYVAPPYADDAGRVKQASLVTAAK